MKNGQSLRTTVLVVPCMCLSLASYLHHIGPDVLIYDIPLVFDNFKESGGEGVVVDPPAGPEGGSHDGVPQA